MHPLDLSGNNNLKNLAGVSRCKNLEKLDIEGTAINSLDVGVFPLLSQLDVSKMPHLTEIKNLHKCTNLQELNGNETALQILSVSGLPRLREISFRDTPDLHLSGLPDAKSLKEVDLRDSPHFDKKQLETLKTHKPSLVILHSLSDKKNTTNNDNNGESHRD